MRSSYSLQRWPQVDASIADIILALNEAGLTTTYCCSAADEDHRECRWLCSGYIAFWSDLPADLVTAMQGYLESPRCIRIYRENDEQIQDAWNWVRKALRDYFVTSSPNPNDNG